MKKPENIKDIEFNKDEEISINYVFSHSKFPEVIFKNYREFLKIASKGEGLLCQFLNELWKKVQNDLNKTNIKITDNNLRIDEYSFQISMINIRKGKKILNITMPSISSYGECKYISIIIDEVPQYFTCELAKSFNQAKPGDYYCLGKWEYNIKKDKYNHEDFGRIDDFSISKYISEIDKKA